MSAVLSRRALLLGAGAALAGAGCRSAAGEPGVLRVGLVSNLTHGPVLASLAGETLAKAIAPLRVEARLFRAGPRVVEALVGRAIDIGITGPSPVVATHARHGSDMLRVVSGIASGGASFVVRKGSPVRTAQDLRGKGVAVTQVGNTQDVALRTWLSAAGLKTKERGGDIAIYALAAPVIKGQMQSGELEGAWLPEPWATRLVQEIGATRLVDERTLWQGGRFATAIAVVRKDFLDLRGADLRRAFTLLAEETRRARTEPDRTEELAYAEIRRRTGNAGPRRAFHDAMGFIDFTTDCMQSEIARFAADAASTGFLPAVDVASLFAPLATQET